jgi:hypothetical protein
MVFVLQTAGLTILSNNTTWYTRLCRRKCQYKSWNRDGLEKWRTAQIIDGYQPKDTFNIDETGLIYNLQPSKSSAHKGDSCHGRTKSKQRVTVLLGCSAYGTEKLPALVPGNFSKHHCFRNVKNLPTKHTAKSNSWMTSATFWGVSCAIGLPNGGKKQKNVAFNWPVCYTSKRYHCSEKY